MKTMMMMGAAMIFAGGLSANVAYAADGQPQTLAQAYYAGPVIENSRAMAAADQLPKVMNVRQAIAAQLTNAGYSNVTVTPSSFYVHARNKAGDPVAMVIGPDSFTQVTEIPVVQVQTQPQPQVQAQPQNQAQAQPQQVQPQAQNAATGQTYQTMPQFIQQ